MFIKKIVLLFIMAFSCILLFKLNNVYSAENISSTSIDYKLIDSEAISRFNEDRVAFQHVQLPGSISYKEDNSVASLLIVKDDQIYLFRDGYDDSKKVQMEGYIQDIRQELPKDLWANKINSKPDYIKISDGRTEKLLNVKEDFVEKNFGDFYRTVRNSLIQKHILIFRRLMKERVESEAHLVRKPISPPAFQEIKEPAKFSTMITAKALDGSIYFAEDYDGDGVTETFYVSFEDGFNWGFKSGPNILFVYNNKEEDIKQLIGKLCYEAYYGTPEEEQLILKTFPKESEIIETFKLEKVALQSPSQSQKSDSGTSAK